MRREELPEFLFRQMKKNIDYYPPLVAEVSHMLNKTAFFPGGRGLWLENKADRFPTILVLGQDFSTEWEYLDMLNNMSNDNLGCPTWRNLRKLFGEASIDINDCFFSNVSMGLRKTKSTTGKFPGFKDKDFYHQNIEFLKYQIEIIKPKTIITLGKYAPLMLAETTSDLDAWKKITKFIEFDVNSLGIKHNVRFNSHTANCVALVHPSMHNSNVKYRFYDGLNGTAAEIKMIQDGLQ